MKNVVISGMEMPETCKDCQLSFYYRGFVYCQTDAVDDVLDDYEYIRHSKCPLKEIEDNEDDLK